MTKSAFLKANVIHPFNGRHCASFEGDKMRFEDGRDVEVLNGIPVLIDESKSIFRVDDVLKSAPITQDSGYRNNSLKNRVRKSILPQLSKDFSFEKRYKQLADSVRGQKVLVIGAGSKIKEYNELFSDALVITSDVHLQFSPDIVFDAHQIPFKDETFDLIIAGQVLEHTFRPWEVAKEMQRCVKHNGLLLVEIPFNFPYHSPPYDFFRFTFTGLRSLFPNCELKRYEVSEGQGSAVAVFNSQFLVDLFSNRYLRMVMVFISRFLFGWIKYLDVFRKRTTYRRIYAPMGFSMLFKKDGRRRTDAELLEAYYKLKNKKKV